MYVLKFVFKILMYHIIIIFLNLVLSNKSQRGKLEKIEILMKNGTYVNCLVNMHYGSNNYIVCRFQIFR